MKLVLKLSILLSFALVVLFTTSCLEEQFDIKNGGKLAANMYPESDVPYLKGVTTQVTVNLNTFANEGVTISGISVTKQFFTAKGNSAPVTFTATGDSFSQTSTQMYADVPISGSVLTEATTDAGDYWTFQYVMVLADGRELTIGDATTVTFQCPSDLAGTWLATGSGTTIYTAFPGATPFGPNASWDGTDNVVLTVKTPGVYEMDQSAGGFYYNYWGGSPEVATLRDVCDNLSIDEKSDQWGYFLRFPSVVKNPNGSITVQWVNGYEDQGTYTMVRQ